jgi:DNA repair photolyase
MPTADTRREPGYRAGRYFLSPMLGCQARCAFCYIFSFGYRYPKGVANEFGSAASIAWILEHEAFVPGEAGSVISIGAWGDPFPPDEDARQVSLEWTRRACETGNRVQLMSRFELDAELIDHIVALVRYPGQLLFSTSLSTFDHWQTVEKFASPPEARARTLQAFHTRGIPTNLMIKPVIPGVTDREVAQISRLMHEYSIRCCVVGELYWDERIERSTAAVAHLPEPLVLFMEEAAQVRHPLDCEPAASLKTLPTELLDDFIGALWRSGIAAFKKSACVNSYTAGVDLGLRDRPEFSGYCVECGMCSSSPGLGQMST